MINHENQFRALGIVVKQSIKNTLISYLGVLIGFINIIWLYPRFLDANQFGLTKLITSVAILSSQFAILGMGHITLKYFPLFRNKTKSHGGFLFISLMIPLIGFIIFSALLWIFRGSIIALYNSKSPLFTDYFFFLFPMIGFTLFFNVLDFYVRSLFRTVFANFVKEILLRFSYLIVIVLYWLDFLNFHQFVIAYVIGTGLQTLILACYTGIIGEFHIRPDFHFLSKSLVLEMIQYGLFTLLAGLTYTAINNVDIIMLGSMSGLADTAIYFVAFSIGTVIQVPTRAISRIAYPLINDAWAHGDLSYVSEIYKKTAINQLLPGIIIFLCIWANIDTVLSFLPAEYAAGKYVILFIGLSKLFDVATGANGGIIMASEKYRFNLYSNLLLLIIAIITNLIFIPRYGIVGAAMATALSIFIINSANIIFLFYHYRIQPFTRKTIFTLGIAVIMLIIAYVPFFPGIPIVQLIIRCALIIVIFSVAIYGLNLSDDARLLIQQIIGIVTSGKKTNN